MKEITEKTLIPISFLVVIVGGIFWLTNIWSDTQANARTIVKIETIQHEFNKTVVDKLEDIRDRLARIEERQKRGR